MPRPASKLTPEEQKIKRREYAKAFSLRMRVKRAELREKMTEDEKRKVREVRNAYKRARRKQKTEEEKMKYINDSAEYLGAKKSQMTEEENRIRLAARSVKDRAKRNQMTKEERRRRLDARSSKDRAKRKQKIAEEERRKYLDARAAYVRARKEQMTEEENKKLDAAYAAKKREISNAQLNERLVADTMDYTNDKCKIESTPERISRLISSFNCESMIKPKYKIARSLMKNALKDVGEMHGEINEMKQSIRQTIVEAIKTTITSYISQKRTNGRREIQITDSDPLSESVRQSTLDDNSIPETAEKKFVCSFCNKKYMTELGVLIHEKEHETNLLNDFRCYKCNEVFGNYNLMTAHYIQEHLVGTQREDDIVDEELERSFMELNFLYIKACHICFMTFRHMRTFSNHIFTHHSDNPEALRWYTISCSFCHKPYPDRGALASHWKSTCYEAWKTQQLSNANNNDNICETCGLKFSSAEFLSSHVHMFHAKAKTGPANIRAQCEYCGKSFENKYTLATHMRFVHERKYEVFCEFCGKSFRADCVLKRHQQSVHFKQTNFQCNICSKRFYTLNSLEVHYNTHTGARPFKCRFCDKCFSAGSSRTSHEILHKGGIVCQFCGDKFKSYGELCAHRKIHKNNVSNPPEKKESNKVYECNVCGKILKTALLLKSHKYIHEDFHRFACNICGKTFRHRGNFYPHKKQHPGIKVELIKLIKSAREKSRLDTSTILPFADSIGLPSMYAPPLQNYQKELSADTSNQPQAEDVAGNRYEHIELHDSPEHDFFEDIETETVNDFAVLEPGGSIVPKQKNKENATIQTIPLKAVNSSTYTPEASEEVAVASTSIPSSFIDFSRANVPFAFIPLVDRYTSQARESAEENTPSGAISIIAIAGNAPVSPIPALDDTKMAEIKIEAEPEENLDDGSTFYSDYHESDFYEPNAKIKQEIKSFPEDPFPRQLIIKLSKLKEQKYNPSKKTPVFRNNSEKRKRLIGRNSKTKDHKSEKGNIQKVDPENSTLAEEVPTKKHRLEKKMRKSAFSYPCKHCEAVCTSTKDFDSHCVTEHPGLKCFQCEKCESSFSTTSLLYKHNKRVHLGLKDKRAPRKPRDPNQERNMFCEICGKAFFSKDLLRKHVSNVHEERKFPCDVCGKVFHSGSNLNGHKIRHTGVKSFVCEECGKGFFRMSELKDHIECVHKKIDRKSEYKIKRKMDRNGCDKPKIQKEKECPFHCVLCSAKFTTESRLTKHMELHDPSRPFACHICGLRYKFLSNVATHKSFVHKQKCLVTVSEGRIPDQLNDN